MKTLMTPSWPAGATCRATVREDAEGVLAILNANSIALNGVPENTLDDLLEVWDDPRLDLAQDTRVVIAADGRLIAYAVLWNKGRESLPVVDVYLHHSEWETDTLTDAALLAWAETRAWEAASAIAPDLRIAMRSYTDVRETRLLNALDGAGYTPIRHSFQMGITFDGAPDPGAWPEGFDLRVLEADDDPVPVFEAFRDAWRDHFGYMERPYEESLESWRREWARDFAPSIWLAAMSCDTVAGFCISRPEYGGDFSKGFVDVLGVRRAFRRRGLAEALLRRNLAALYATGKREVLLYVDGESLTGATRVYERAGMSVRRRFTLCEKELRPGIDPSTHDAGAG